MSDFDHLTERQQIALQVLAFVDLKRLHDALRAYADQALADPKLAEVALACLRYRRENGISRPVTKLRAVR